MLHKVIQRYYPMAKPAMDRILALASELRFRKGQDLVQRGRPDQHEYIVKDGVCRSYLVDPEGEEVSLSFYTEGMVLAPHVTRIEQGLSTINYQASTDLEVWAIPAKGFETLMVEDLEVRSFGNSILQQELQRKVRKEIGMASHTAKQRLIAFRAEFRMLENRIPHSEIASYLGITPISLSRLRGELP